MTKSDLVDFLVTENPETFESKAQADRAVGAVIGAIEAGLKEDGAVQIMGFGTFLLKERAARMARNPITGDPVKVPAKTTVKFKVGRTLKEFAQKVKVKTKK